MSMRKRGLEEVRGGEGEGGLLEKWFWTRQL